MVGVEYNLISTAKQGPDIILAGPWFNAVLWILSKYIWLGVEKDLPPGVFAYLAFELWSIVTPIGFAMELTNLSSDMIRRIMPAVYTSHEQFIYYTILALAYLWGVSVSTSDTVKDTFSRTIRPITLSVKATRLAGKGVDTVMRSLLTLGNGGLSIAKMGWRIGKSIWYNI